ncbi:phosphotransferase [Catellatospora sichuanensis]|uniref:phosphotransferase n=1 Tax=Catellatospora sichuanensis TaxID=1969805 RepID=UPI0011832B75|nr:phosphotransferase [Catellatospora sichuanensis]
MIPADVLSSLAGGPATLLTLEARPLGGDGAATAAVTLLTGTLRHGPDERSFSLVRKQFRPLATGRHAVGSHDERHWAYWRREPLAYASGLLPTGPGLAAPRCLGVTEDAVYLAHVTGPREDPRTAAQRLAVWQAGIAPPDLPWLAGHQLAQRIAVSDLDWTAVDALPQAVAIWSRRRELLAELDAVPSALSHGDFHRDQLVAAGDVTVVLDWGTLGVAPAGADVAHLALSTLDGSLVDAYLAAAGHRLDPEAVRRGYQLTLVLTAVSRLHWMLTRGVRPPPGYLRFLTRQIDAIS